MAESLFPSRIEREAALRAIGGVLDLMASAGTLDERAPEAICPHGNGYSMWFIPDVRDMLGTVPLTPMDILKRIEAFHAGN